MAGVELELQVGVGEEEEEEEKEEQEEQEEKEDEEEEKEEQETGEAIGGGGPDTFFWNHHGDVWHGDLNSRAVVTKLMNHIEELEAEGIEKCDDDGAREYLEHVRYQACADGSPMYEMVRVLLEDDVTLSAGRNPGPFHWAMRLVHCISRLYEATHLDLILKCIGKEYRDSEGKMAWFKYPTDPNQAFAEIQEQQMAFYVEMA